MQVRQRKRLLMQGRARKVSLHRRWQIALRRELRALVYASRVHRRWRKRLMPNRPSSLLRVIEQQERLTIRLRTLTPCELRSMLASQSTHPQD